jgi:hypothetical protein
MGLENSKRSRSSQERLAMIYNAIKVTIVSAFSDQPFKPNATL